MQTKFIRINSADNVAVAIEALPRGEIIDCDGVRIVVDEDIPAGHKFSLSTIRKGENVIKYGYPTGRAVTDISAGRWVNENNVKTNLSGVSEYEYKPIRSPKIDPALCEGRTFRGFRRADGTVGIRNEIWIIPTVGCVNGIAERLARRLREEKTIPPSGREGADGVTNISAFPHNYGCSQLGDDHENTRRILRDMVLHPNAGGVLVVGLGCENNQIGAFREFLGPVDPERVKFMETQKIEGDESEYGMGLLRDIFAIAEGDRRVEVPVSELRVGLKCGGSDGFSGITANPMLGAFSDILTAGGGSTVLTEVPEMFGAETILMARAKDKAVFERTVRLINDFKNYFVCNGQPVYENPSPGNKAGGISTLEEKSLGCTQKSGGARVQDVLEYGGRLRVRGLTLLSAPGNDLVASTALAASGCQMVLFTTGLGTPFGTFVPTVKISTTGALAEAKPHWIDFDAGDILRGRSIAETAGHFLDYVVRVADGEHINNEKNDYREIAIFKTGVTL